MCLALPARVVSVGEDHPDLARVELGGRLRVVNVGLLDDPVAPGDWILVHLGFALSRVTGQEADAALDVFRDERRAAAGPGGLPDPGLPDPGLPDPDLPGGPSDPGGPPGPGGLPEPDLDPFGRAGG